MAAGRPVWLQGTSNPNAKVSLPSIVLITLSKANRSGGVEARVRLDLGKGMFLDSTPKGLTPDEETLVACDRTGKLHLWDFREAEKRKT